MKLKITGLQMKPASIYFVRFSSNGVEKTKCTSTNTYMKDAEIFAKNKDVEVTMEVLKELKGREHKSFTE